MARIISYLPTLSAVVLSLCLIVQKTFLDKSDPYRCNAFRDGGRWLDQATTQSDAIQPHYWQPPGCILHEYNAHEIEQCLECDRLLFVGDSNVRQLFWAVALKANKTKADHAKLYAEKHGNLSLEVNCYKLEFLWDPYLNSTVLRDEIVSSGTFHNTDSLLSLQRHETQTTIITGGGLWHARYLGDDYLTIFKNKLDTLFNLSRSDDVARSATTLAGQRNLQLLVPVLSPNFDMLDEYHNATLTPERLATLNDYLLQSSGNTNMQLLWSFSSMLQPQIFSYEEGGIHLQEDVMRKQADIILNLRCNAMTALQHYPFDKTCCAAPVQYNMVQMIALILALMAVVLKVASAALTAAGFESPGSQWQQRIGALAVVALACIYCFLADRTQLFQKMQKTTDQEAFLWMLSFIMVLGALTTVRQPTINHMSEKDFSSCSNHSIYLSRDQTEEWKGWMQAVILLYHYYGMSKILWVYQLIRLLVASYLFLTGYGHALFFLEKNDFTLRRVVRVLVRLNMLSIILAYTMQTDWDFYYFPALSSFWFLVTYLTMRLWSWRKAGVIPVFVAACTVKLAIHHPGLLEKIVDLLHCVCRLNINVHEVRFRISLDMYIVYMGMLLGIGHVEFARLISPLPSSLTQQVQWRPRFGPWVGLLAAFTIIGLYAASAAQFSDKYAYNKWHTVMSPFPVLAFLVLRNAIPLFRECHSWLFAWLGRCSLETFILQYHVWLAADTKGLLRLGLGFDDPMWRFGGNIEAAIITVFFLWTSWGVSCATPVLTEWFVGSSQSQERHEAGNNKPVSFVRRLSTKLGLIFRLALTLLILATCNWM